MNSFDNYGEYQTYWHERNFACRLREFVYRGHRCVSLENQQLRVVIAADKGADIIEFLYKPLDVDALWHSPTGLRAFDHYRASSPLAEGQFRQYYPGGWHEMLPNGAAPCSHRGAHFGQHGEATLLPWEYEIIVDEPERIEVKFRVRLVRMPLIVEKSVVLTSGSSALQISESIQSFADQELEVIWGQHPTFGWPFLEEGCRVYLPACVAVVGTPLPNSRLQAGQRASWPLLLSPDGQTVDLSVIPGPSARSQDYVRLENLADGWFALVNPKRGIGFALRWDVGMFPTLGFWQVFRGGFDYPWYGMNYLAALEPAVDLPSLSDAAAANRAVSVPGRGRIGTTFEASMFVPSGPVHVVEPGGGVR